VANEVLERQLTSDEITAVGNAVGDYLDWFQAIENAILPLHSKRERRIDDVRSICRTSADARWTHARSRLQCVARF
jgi:hypothetical protein